MSRRTSSNSTRARTTLLRIRRDVDWLLRRVNLDAIYRAALRGDEPLRPARYPSRDRGSQ